MTKLSKNVPRAGLVHRIDKDTSGLLVVARTLEAHTALVAALAAHEVEREYLAVCVGAMTGGGTVDEPIGRHRTAAHQDDGAVGRPSRRDPLPHRETISRAHAGARAASRPGARTRSACISRTSGYPIVGDPVYGGRRRVPKGATPELLNALDGFGRQALHAARLSFTHPKSGKRVAYDAPLPDDLKGLLDVLARDTAEAA